jgi:hypothetical protein
MVALKKSSAFLIIHCTPFREFLDEASGSPMRSNER